MNVVNIIFVIFNILLKSIFKLFSLEWITGLPSTLARSF